MTAPRDPFVRAHRAEQVEVWPPLEQTGYGPLQWPWDAARAEQRMWAAFRVESSLAVLRESIRDWLPGAITSDIVRLPR